MSAFHAPKLTTARMEEVKIGFSFLPNGASPTVRSGEALSLTRPAVGRYVVTLKKEYRYLLNNIGESTVSFSQNAVGTAPHVGSVGVVDATAGTIEVYTHVASTGLAGDMASNALNFVNVVLWCKKSQVSDGSGV